jgi:multiple sugar transport system substrate-binding protein
MSKRVWIILFVTLTFIVSSCAPAPVAPAPTQASAPEVAAPSAEKPTEPPKQEQVTLKLWVTEDNQVFFPELIKAFEAKYPNIKVETTLIPEEQYGTKIETALAAGAPPDIAYVGERRWYREGVVLPLDDVIAKEGIDLSTWNASIIGPKGVENAEEACKFEDKIYCLGSYTGAVVLFYNKDMFDAAGVKYPTQWPPISIDEYVDMACKLTNKDKEVWGTANGDPVTWLPWETIVSPDGRTVTGIVNGSTSVGVHEKIAGLFQNGCAPSLNVMDPWQQGVDFFSQGKIAMVVTDFQSLFKIENAKINYGVAHPPAPDGVTPFFNVWTDGLGVFAKAAHPEEAKLFIAFQGTEGQRIRVKVTGDFPVSTAIAEEMNWAGDMAGRKEALEVLKHARPNVYMPNRWEVAGPLFDAFGYIVSKEKTTQDALDEAAPLMQENLDKEWKDWEK